jgi:hypothetical protein
VEYIDLSVDYYDLAVKHLDLQAKRRDNLAEHKVLTLENINLLAKHYDLRILQAEKSSSTLHALTKGPSDRQPKHCIARIFFA